MASESERITSLFSMYNDDDDDDDEEQNDYSPNPPPRNRTPSPRSPLRPDESPTDPKTLTSPSEPTLSRIRSPYSPPLSPRFSPMPEFADRLRGRKGTLGIVDYGHDEMAVSPEHNGDERTASVAVNMLREDMQRTNPPIADNLEKTKSDASMAVDFTCSDHEIAQAEETGTDSADTIKDDLLSRFLGPPVTTKCPEELQQKINKFLAYRITGRSFNKEVRNRKDYRNPDFLQHAVSYQDIDQIGTCFSKEVFDPHGYDKRDYYDEIEAEISRERERKEQERKKSPRVDFVPGGIQPPAVAPILKTSAIPISSSLQPAIATGDTGPRETRSKKSKWDKVDGDVKNDALPAGAAAVLSAAAVGGGYSGFAQQKRKEAEEKKSSDKKSDKRS